MRLLRRGPRVGRQETPAGAYEVQFRLESSYRWLGLIFFAIGVIGFLIGIVTGHPLIFLLSGPAFGAGLWIWWNDPREYLVIDPRRFRLQMHRVYGKNRKVRADVDLHKMVRLEIARYLAKPKGKRAMILLVRQNGTLEKVDDRPDDPRLNEVCEEAAALAKLEFLDRGRIDIGDLPRETGEADDSQETVTT